MVCQLVSIDTIFLKEGIITVFPLSKMKSNLLIRNRNVLCLNTIGIDSFLYSPSKSGMRLSSVHNPRDIPLRFDEIFPFEGHGKRASRARIRFPLGCLCLCRAGGRRCGPVRAARWQRTAGRGSLRPPGPCRTVSASASSSPSPSSSLHHLITTSGEWTRGSPAVTQTRSLGLADQRRLGLTSAATSTRYAS